MQKPPATRCARLVAIAMTALTSIVFASGCGVGKQDAPKTAAARQPASSSDTGQSGCTCGNVAAQARADAFADVAKRIYRQEHTGAVGRTVAKHLSQNTALLGALAAGDRTAIRAEARKPVITHEVRVRLVRGSQVLMDAGLPFVVQAAQAELRGPTGKSLARVEVSIQDVIGFVKLVRRETGAQVVVRGQNGRVATLLPAAAKAKLPAAGEVTVAGGRYLVRSFPEVDFTDKPLTVWILNRV